MNIKVRFFASIKQTMGVDSEKIEIIEGMTLENFIKDLKKRHSALEGKMKLLVAVNGEYVDPHIVLRDEDEVALFPPVSGG